MHIIVSAKTKNKILSQSSFIIILHYFCDTELTDLLHLLAGVNGISLADLEPSTIIEKLPTLLLNCVVTTKIYLRSDCRL